MRKLIPFVLTVAVAITIANGCAKKPTLDDKILAKVSNKTLTIGDLKSRIGKLPSYYKEVVIRNKKKFLDETVIEMMFYEEAIRQGLDSDAEVKEVLREAKKKILVAKLIKNNVEDKITVSDSEKRLYYENHKDEFKTPELWRASHILVPTEAEAKSVLDELSKGASFEDLARTRSTDATATRGGDVGFFRQGQVVPDFEAAAAKLTIGQMSPIVHSQFGYHVIKLTDKKLSAIEPYEKAKHRIEDELKKKKRSEYFDKLVIALKNKYNVEIEDDVFKSLEAMDGKKSGVSAK